MSFKSKILDTPVVIAEPGELNATGGTDSDVTEPLLSGVDCWQFFRKQSLAKLLPKRDIWIVGAPNGVSPAFLSGSFGESDRGERDWPIVEFHPPIDIGADVIFESFTAEVANICYGIHGDERAIVTFR